MLLKQCERLGLFNTHGEITFQEASYDGHLNVLEYSRDQSSLYQELPLVYYKKVMVTACLCGYTDVVEYLLRNTDPRKPEHRALE